MDKDGVILIEIEGAVKSTPVSYLLDYHMKIIKLLFSNLPTRRVISYRLR
jgi:hypothetical protein